MDEARIYRPQRNEALFQQMMLVIQKERKEMLLGLCPQTIMEVEKNGLTILKSDRFLTPRRLPSAIDFITHTIRKLQKRFIRKLVDLCHHLSHHLLKIHSNWRTTLNIFLKNPDNELMKPPKRKAVLDWLKGIQRMIGRFDPVASLKSALSLWFILFALIPLLVIVSYTSYLFNQRMNDELLKRLSAFEKGIDLELIDVEEKLRIGGLRHANDFYLMNLVRQAKQARQDRKTMLENVTQSIIENYITDRISYFDESGRHLLSVSPKRLGEGAQLPREYQNLPPFILEQLVEQRQIIAKLPHPNVGFSIDCFTTMKLAGKTIGIMKETVLLDRYYSLGTKARTGLDICLLDPNFQLLISTFSLAKERSFRYPEKKYEKIISRIEVKDENYLMMTKGLFQEDGKPFGYLSILVSRANTDKTLSGIRNIFILISFGLTIIVILFTRVASNQLLRPIDQLLLATRDIEKGIERPVAVPPMQEIGKLVNSFNAMSGSLLKARKELESKVEQLHKTNEELKNTQAQLIHTSKMVSLGQLVAGIAHELNNPIGYTYSNISHLKDTMPKIHEMMKRLNEEIPKLPKTAQKKIEELKKKLNFDFILKDIDNIIQSSLDGTQRTKEIVVGLRNFSRLDEAEIKEVDLHEGLENTLKLLTSELKNRITVHKEYGKLPKVSCYPSQINQVFLNILTNAIQAIFDKGDKGEKGDIWIRTMVVKDEIQISIRDSGKGILPEHLDRIFDPFFTTKDVGKGTGLGLSVSYGIIKKHKGEIRVESKIGEGSTFTIALRSGETLS